MNLEDHNHEKAFFQAIQDVPPGHMLLAQRKVNNIWYTTYFKIPSMKGKLKMYPPPAFIMYKACRYSHLLKYWKIKSFYHNCYRYEREYMLQPWSTHTEQLRGSPA